MIRSLATLPIMMLACCVAETQHTNEQVSFRATVQDVVMLSSFSGAVIPVHVDPMFALTVRIESVASGITNFAAGSVVTFAIHSPSLLFAGEDTKGKTYDFWLSRRIENGKVRYSGLEIQRKQAKTPVETNRRPASPLDAGRQFGRGSCAPTPLSAAVAHLYR